MEHVKIDETKLEEYGLLAKDWCLVNGKYNHIVFKKRFDSIFYFKFWSDKLHFLVYKALEDFFLP